MFLGTLLKILFHSLLFGTRMKGNYYQKVCLSVIFTSLRLVSAFKNKILDNPAKEHMEHEFLKKYKKKTFSNFIQWILENSKEKCR